MKNLTDFLKRWKPMWIHACKYGKHQVLVKN